MFGVARKKTKPTTTRRPVRSSAASSSSSDDDGDDGALHRVQKHNSRKKKDKASKKNKKAVKSTMLSFDPEEGGGDDNDDIISSQKKSKKRKKKHKKKKNSSGLGYGGVMMSMNASDESSSDRESKKMDVELDKDTTGGGYDIAALAKLKSEQKRSTFVKDEKDEVHLSKPVVDTSSLDKDINMMGENDNNKKESIEEEEFIPLSGDKSSTKHKNKNNIDPVVLTGDEALAFAQEDENDNNIEFDHGLQSPPSPPTLDGGVDNNDKSMKKKGDIDAEIMMDVDEPSSSNEVDEGNRQWEDITARRAGVLPPKSGVSSNRASRQQVQINNSSSLGEIRTSLQPTIINLENVYSDLESSISRHESTLSSTRDELSTKERTVEKHGKALEYYQGLREDLATWMGALRELNDMVTKVEDAQCKLEAEMTWIRLERFVEWGNDCTEVLESNGLLKNKIMGKNGSLESSGSILKAVMQVDEFGRDMSSMASMSRVKRWNQRRKRCINRLQGGDDESLIEQSMGCTNKDNIDTSEFDEWKRRHEALVQAIAIIPNLVKDEYLSISNLCALFLEWERTYPEDYVSCYADMSLVQMISVLVRLDLCGQWDVLGLHAQSTAAHYEVTESKWFRDLCKINSQRIRGVDEKMKKGKTNPRKDIHMEVVQKQIVSRILDLFSFENEGKESTCLYDPFSVDQTKCLCSMMGSLLGYFSSSHVENSREMCKEIVQKVLNALLSSVKYHIERVVVPIADESKIIMTRNEFLARDVSNGIDSEVSDSILYATTIQARELCQLVKNILGHWYPTLNKELDNQNENLTSLVQYVFMDVISLRILPVLHSLHGITSSGNDNNKKYIELPKMLITEILDVVKIVESGDEDSSWVMLTAPLRVAVKQWDSR